MKFLLAILILMLSSCSSPPETIVEYIEVPKVVIREVPFEVVKEVPVEVVREVDRELRDFTSIKEFKEVISRYTDGLTVLDWDCEPLVRFLVKEIWKSGYYVDSEIDGVHMVIKGFVKTNQGQKVVCFYDLHADRFWHAYKVNSVYRVPEAGSPTTTEPNWGKGGKPKDK